MRCVWSLLGISVALHAAEISINHVTVLLPHNTISAGVERTFEFPIEAHNGCFTWKTQKVDLISLRGDPAHTCTQGGKNGFMRALVIPRPIAANSPLERRSSWVIAEDIITGKKAECEVFVDKVQRLEILTATRTINVGDLEKLFLQAFDSIGNVFTSLAGLPFEWTNSAEHLLRRVTFSEAELKVDPWYLAREKSGIATDLLPVQGLQPGVTKMTARLLDPSHATQATVLLSVIEPLCLEPDEVWMAPLTEVDFTLRTKLANRDHEPEHLTQEADTNSGTSIATTSFTFADEESQCTSFKRLIAMPSTQYKWALLPSSAATSAADRAKKPEDIVNLNKDSGHVITRALGHASVRVYDVDMADNGKVAQVHVVNPTQLKLRVRQRRPESCADRWYLTLDRAYTIDFLVLDDQGHKMVISNMKFTVKFSGGKNEDRTPEETMELSVVPAGRGNSFTISARDFVVRAIQLGVTHVSARLDSVGSYVYPADSALHTTIDLTVTNPIKALPDMVVLPYWKQQPPRTPVVHSTQINATGGSGVYDWESSAPAVCFISTTGVATGHTLGSAFVHVSDQCNPDNAASVRVFVSEPADPFFLPGPVESEVDSALTLAVGVSDKEGRRFTECSGLGLETWLSSSTIFTISSPHDDVKCEAKCSWPGSTTSCWKFTVRALAHGFTTVHARIESEDILRNPPKRTTDGGANRRDCMRVISGFLPLQVVPKVLHLAVGSTFNLTWSEGPLPWPQGGFRSTINPAGEDLHAANERLYTHRPDFTVLTSAVVPLRKGSWEQIAGTNADELERQGKVLLYEPGDLSQTNYEGGVVAVTPSSHTMYSYRLSCLDVSYQHAIAVRVRVGNLPSAAGGNPQPVVSEVLVKLLCYPRLVLVPRRMVLGVNAMRPVLVRQHTEHLGNLITPDDVKLAGLLDHTHPLMQNVTFHIDDPTVASVSRVLGHSDNPAGRWMITGLKLGETVIHARVVHPVLGPLMMEGLFDSVGVLVHFHNLLIRAPTQQLLPSHVAFFHIEGVYGELPGDPAFNAVSCRWRSDSPGLQLRPTLSSVAETKNYVVDGPSVGVIARRPGKYRLSASINVHMPPPTNNISHFEHWVDITVLESLVLLSPSSVVIPFGARLPLLCTLDHSELTYSLLSPITTIGGGGQGAGAAGTAAGGGGGYPAEFAAVTSNGVLVTQPLPKLYSKDPFGDVVILISTHGVDRENAMSTQVAASGSSGSSSSSILSPLESGAPRAFLPLSSQTRQTVAVKVAIRAPQQLAVRLRRYLTGPLCVGEEVVVEVVVLDRLGHAFDTLEGWTPGDTAIKISSSSPSVVTVSKTTLDDEEVGSNGGTAVSKGKLASRGILSVLTLEAVGVETGRAVSSSVIRISLVNQTTVNPLFLRIDTADAAHCEEPVVAQNTLRFSAGAELADLSDEAGFYPPSTLHRKRHDFIEALKRDISHALAINTNSIVIRRVAPSTGIVDLEFFPAHSTQPFHPDQWQTAYRASATALMNCTLTGTGSFTDDGTDDLGLPSSTSPSVSSSRWRLPLEASQDLYVQLVNPSSALRNTPLGKYLEVPSGGASALKITTRPWRIGGADAAMCEQPTLWTDQAPEEVTAISVRVIEPAPTDTTTTGTQGTRQPFKDDVRSRTVDRTLKLFMATQLMFALIGLLWCWMRRPANFSNASQSNGSGHSGNYPQYQQQQHQHQGPPSHQPPRTPWFQRTPWQPPSEMRFAPPRTPAPAGGFGPRTPVSPQLTPVSSSIHATGEPVRSRFFGDSNH